MQLKNELFISLKDGVTPKSVSGATIALYEEKKGYKTYKITRDGANKVTLAV